MKTFLAAAVCVVLLSASSLFAFALNPQPLPPGAHGPSGSGHTDSIVSPRDPQASLPAPAAVGKCKTDAALKRKCTAAWDHCVRLAAAHPKCKEHWATCCAPPQ